MCVYYISLNWLVMGLRAVCDRAPCSLAIIICSPKLYMMFHSKVRGFNTIKVPQFVGSFCAAPRELMRASFYYVLLYKKSIRVHIMASPFT